LKRDFKRQRRSLAVIKIRNIFRNLGLRQGLNYLLFRLYTHFIFDERYKQLLTATTFKGYHPPPGFTVKPFNSIDDVPEQDLVYMRRNQIYSTLADFQDYLEDDRTLWICYENGVPAGYEFSMTKGHKAYLTEGEVFIDFRGKHYFALLHCHIIAILLAQGVEEIGSSVHVLNTPSIRASEETGFEKINKKVFTRLGGRLFQRRSCQG